MLIIAISCNIIINNVLFAIKIPIIAICSPKTIRIEKIQYNFT